MSAESTCAARSPNVAARMLGDELLIMSGRDAMLLTLNQTAAILWNALDGLTPLDILVRRHICSAFDVDPQSALRDANELVRGLADVGVVTLTQPHANEPAESGGENMTAP